MAKYDKILIIDDDDINNYVTTKFLRRLAIGDNIATQLDGASALNYLKNAETNFPRLIIVDLNMPIMDGLEFLSVYENRYWKNHKDTKLVIITTSIREDDRTQVLKFQCVSGFLNKPVNIENLTGL